MRAVVLAALAACSGPNAAFECTGDQSCRNGATTGTCEATGFCSFPDSSCPNGSRYGAAAGNGLANQCVGAGGDGGTGTTEPHALGAWANTMAQPMPRYTFALAQNGSNVYVIGGIAGTTGHADVWEASGNPGAVVPSAAIASWTQTTALPAARWTFGATYDTGFIYVFGGRTNATSETADVYSAPVMADGTVGTWTATTSLPQVIKCEAVASSGPNVYVIGGKHSGQGTATIFRAQMQTGGISPWAAGGTLDTTVFDHVAVVVNGYLYVIGGCVDGSGVCSQLLDIVEFAKINADGSLGAFKRTTPLPMARSHHTAAVSANGDIYVLGGTYGAKLSDPETTDVVAAHPRADGTISAWRTMTPLPIGRRRASAAVIGNTLVFIQSDTQAVQIQ